MSHILYKLMIQNNDNTYKIRSDIILEEKIPIKFEKDYVVITLENDSYLIPTTIKGLEIIDNTYNFIGDLLYYKRTISNFIQQKIEIGIISDYTINHFHNIVNAYKDLNIELIDENILVFNRIRTYKINTKMEVFYLANIEILIRILNQNIEEEDIKILEDDNRYTPFIFPVRQPIDFYCLEYNFYTSELELSDLITEGQLKLNNKKR